MYKWKVTVKGVTISKHIKKVTALKKASSIRYAKVLPIRKSYKRKRSSRY